MHVDPQAEHRWLQRILGSWSFDSTCSMGPGQPPGQFNGKETVRALGDIWVIGEGEGEMPGGSIGRTIITLGYDPLKARFTGSFIGSMMTHFWLYEGQLQGDTLTLDAEGPSFTDPATMAQYQDIVTLRSDDERILTSRVKNPDGNWTEFMTATYRRTGAAS
jgi:hypothetical protein